MEIDTPLPPGEGNEWEDRVFGSSTPVGTLERPEYMGFWKSLQAVMWAPLQRIGKDGQIETYDPANPNWGMSRLLWFSVRKHLPLRVHGRSSGTLFLHIACRRKRTALDTHHGVDAFFFWEGAYATVDVSFLDKDKADLKANFLITPDDMEPRRLDEVGFEIARFLNYCRRQKEGGRRRGRRRRAIRR